MGRRASKKRTHRINLWPSQIQAWKLFIIFILLAFLTATSLRLDHLKMVRLRGDVIAADRQGDPNLIKERLGVLQHFTSTHIVFNQVSENGERKIIFGTGPFYLEQQYVKKAQAELAKAKALAAKNSSTNPNGNVFQKAALVCDAAGKKHGWRYPDAAYIDCFQSELAKYPSSNAIDSYLEAMLPSTNLYRQDFSSPIWYPSRSGFLLIILLLLGIYLLWRCIFWLILSLILFFQK